MALLRSFDVLHERSFARYLASVTVSTLGSGMAIVALAFAVLDFGGATDLSNVFGNAPQSGPKTASNAPPPVKTAPAGPTTGNESLTKRSVILFAKDAPDPAKSALGALKFLAGDLNAAMVTPNARIELQAFGGAKGDKGSDARRLSLKRALSIRQVLIDDGVSADRIDVHAMGGVDDTGPTDRVDVYVKA